MSFFMFIFMEEKEFGLESPIIEQMRYFMLIQLRIYRIEDFQLDVFVIKAETKTTVSTEAKMTSVAKRATCV